MELEVRYRIQLTERHCFTFQKKQQTGMEKLKQQATRTYQSGNPATTNEQ
jgi:hypothetical protein